MPRLSSSKLWLCAAVASAGTVVFAQDDAAAGFAAQLSEKDAEIAACAANLQTTQSQALELQTQCNAGITELQEKLDTALAAAAEATGLEEKVASLEGEITDAKASAETNAAQHQAAAAASAEAAAAGKTAQDELIEAQALLKDLQNKFADSDGKLSMSERKVKQLQSEIKAAAGAAASQAKVGLVQKHWDHAVNVAISAHKETVAPLYEPATKAAKESTEAMIAAGSVLLVALHEALAVVGVHADFLVEKHGKPMLREAYAEGSAFYDAHLAVHLDPIFDMISETGMTEAVNQAFQMAKMAVEDIKALVSPVMAEVWIVVSGGLAHIPGYIVTAEYTRSFYDWCSEPIKVQVLSETIDFEYGIPEACGVFGVLAIFMYYVVYRFILRVLICKIFLYWISYKLIIRGVICNFLVGAIIRFSWVLLTQLVSLLILIIQLSACCGCCGACFRRKKGNSARGSSVEMSTTASSISGKTPSSGKLAPHKKRKM